MTETSDLTYERLVQSLAERVIVLYLNLLGHEISNISCQLGDKALTMVIENSLTRPEKLLVSKGQQELAKRVRATINKAIEPDLKFLIEEVINTPVVDILSDTGFDTGCTSMIVVLAATPQVVESSDLVNAKSQQQSIASEENGDG